MRGIALAAFAVLVTVLSACTCYALCSGNIVVQLAEVPDGPYEIEVELADETLTWSCLGDPADTDPGLHEARCDEGLFSSLYFGNRVRKVTVTVDGTPNEVDAECEKMKVCGQKEIHKREAN